MFNRDIIIREEASIKDTLKKLNNVGEKTLLVVDENDCLLGTITDGDLRKHIIKGVDIGSGIRKIYNRNPITLRREEYDAELSRRILSENKIEILPIVDNNHKVLDFVVWSELYGRGVKTSEKKAQVGMPVVVMAGGKGTRMAPFTNILPKPLIPVGEKTVLELIISGFQEYGIDEYNLILNYKGEMIKAYFDGIERDYKLRYFWESDYYGTAGSLSLIEKSVGSSFILSNCDVIVKANYEEVASLHKESNAAMTVLTSIQHHRIPYGVIEFKEGGEIAEIKEKPEYTFTVNTGVYILDRECLKFIPHDTFFHVTDLIEVLLRSDKKVRTYPVNEKDYIDVGQWKEYKEAVVKLG